MCGPRKKRKFGKIKRDQCRGRKNFSSSLLGSLAGLIIDIRQINRRKTNFLNMVWEPHKSMRPKGQPANRGLYEHPELRKGVGAWGYKRKRRGDVWKIKVALIRR